jgi:hypothetical protein
MDPTTVSEKGGCLSTLWSILAMLLMILFIAMTLYLLYAFVRNVVLGGSIAGLPHMGCYFSMY